MSWAECRRRQRERSGDRARIWRGAGESLPNSLKPPPKDVVRGAEGAGREQEPEKSEGERERESERVSLWRASWAREWRSEGTGACEPGRAICLTAQSPAERPNASPQRPPRSSSSIGLHSILSFTHEDYGRATSFKNIAAHLPWGEPSLDPVPAEYFDHASDLPAAHPGSFISRRANASILMLARNSDVNDAVRSVRRLEDRFNKKFGYPWVFLNEEPFSDEFKT